MNGVFMTMNETRAFFQFEIKKMIRNRSVLIFGALFSVLLTAITVVQFYAMPSSSGFTRYTASFLNVTLFLLPLFTLAIGALSVASDLESRWFALLSTYTLKSQSYRWAKWLSLVLSFALMLSIGYGIVLIIHAFYATLTLDVSMIGFAFLAVAIFSALSIVVGSVAKNRIQGLTIALGVWAFCLLIADYLVMAIGTFVAGVVLHQFVLFATFTNPVQWIRMGFILYSGNSSVLGPAYYDFTVFMLTPLGIGIYIFCSMLWVILPLWVSGKILSRSGDK